MDPGQSLHAAEQALRNLVAVVLQAKFGDDWADTAVDQAVRDKWQVRRADEERQRAGHVGRYISDLAFADLGDLDAIITARGHWNELFKDALGDKDEHKALIRVLLHNLNRIRRPVAHTRPLLPHEQDLISGIAGLLRNRVTIYLSSQDPDGDYYPRIERVLDSLGNETTPESRASEEEGFDIRTEMVLEVGQTVAFRCEGNDPQGRSLRWRLDPAGGGVPRTVDGAAADIPWTVGPESTGTQSWAMIWLTHTDGPYHRNMAGMSGCDDLAIFRYRVVPPRA